MLKEIRFHCPHCQATFTLWVEPGDFACTRCGRRFILVEMGKRRYGWMEKLTGSWVTQEIHPLGKRPTHRSRRRKPNPTAPPSKKDLAQMGAARARRARRQARRFPASLLLIMLTLFLVGISLSLPAVVMGQPAGVETLDLALETDTPLASATATRAMPSATPRPSATPSPTPTQTPLPARLVAATAWQATVDQAARFSYATQTQAAGSYAATQTAMPPILTVMAQERSALATQKAATATARVSGNR